MKKRMKKLLACGSGFLSIAALLAIPMSINWNGVLNSFSSSTVNKNQLNVVDKNTNSTLQGLNLDSSNNSFNDFIANENFDQ